MAEWSPAAKGAATGAALGSVVPGIGTAIGAGIGGLIGGGSDSPQEALARKEAKGTTLKNPKKLAKAMLARDMAKFQADPRSAGLSAEQREEMMGGAMQAATQGAGTLSRQLSREAMGAGGTGGYLTEAARQAGAGISEAGAKASAEAQRMTEQMIAQKAQDLQNRLAAAAGEQMQAQQYYTGIAAQPIYSGAQELAGYGGSAVADINAPKQRVANIPTSTGTPS